MILIMLGAPATGKGTTATNLSAKLGIPQVSTGDIFRKAIAEKTPVGHSRRNSIPTFFSLFHCAP